MSAGFWLFIHYKIHDFDVKYFFFLATVAMITDCFLISIATIFKENKLFHCDHAVY